MNLKLLMQDVRQALYKHSLIRLIGNSVVSPWRRLSWPVWWCCLGWRSASETHPGCKYRRPKHRAQTAGRWHTNSTFILFDLLWCVCIWVFVYFCVPVQTSSCGATRLQLNPDRSHRCRSGRTPSALLHQDQTQRRLQGERQTAGQKDTIVRPWGQKNYIRCPIVLKLNTRRQ